MPFWRKGSLKVQSHAIDYSGKSFSPQYVQEPSPLVQRNTGMASPGKSTLMRHRSENLSHQLQQLNFPGAVAFQNNSEQRTEEADAVPDLSRNSTMNTARRNSFSPLLRGSQNTLQSLKSTWNSTTNNIFSFTKNSPSSPSPSCSSPNITSESPTFQLQTNNIILCSPNGPRSPNSNLPSISSPRPKDRTPGKAPRPRGLFPSSGGRRKNGIISRSTSVPLGWSEEIDAAMKAASQQEPTGSQMQQEEEESLQMKGQDCVNHAESPVHVLQFPSTAFSSPEDSPPFSSPLSTSQVADKSPPSLYSGDSKGGLKSENIRKDKADEEEGNTMAPCAAGEKTLEEIARELFGNRFSAPQEAEDEVVGKQRSPLLSPSSSGLLNAPGSLRKSGLQPQMGLKPSTLSDMDFHQSSGLKQTGNCQDATDPSGSIPPPPPPLPSSSSSTAPPSFPRMSSLPTDFDLNVFVANYQTGLAGEEKRKEDREEEGEEEEYMPRSQTLGSSLGRLLGVSGRQGGRAMGSSHRASRSFQEGDARQGKFGGIPAPSFGGLRNAFMGGSPGSTVKPRSKPPRPGGSRSANESTGSSPEPTDAGQIMSLLSSSGTAVVSGAVGAIKGLGLARVSSLPKDLKVQKFDSLNKKSKHTCFQLAELKFATSNFSDSCILGQGGFGAVYKGVLPVGHKEVAVKVLRTGSSQGEEEFVTELELLSRLSHKHLVKLLGFCCTGKDRLLVYQFLANGSLYDHLHGPRKAAVGPLCWERRVKAAFGSARGIRYLHNQRPQILHRDIKAANILLTGSFEAKVADFGCAKLIGCGKAQVTSNGDAPGGASARIIEYVSVGMGTVGHMAPEVLMAGEISAASDTFSFGVVLLELLTGKEPIDRSRPANSQSLVSWATPLIQAENWDDLIDPFLISSKGLAPHGNPLFAMARLAAKCLQFDPNLRPTFDTITQSLAAIAQCDKDNSGVDLLPTPPRSVKSATSSTNSSPSITRCNSRTSSTANSDYESTLTNPETFPTECSPSEEEIPELSPFGVAGSNGGLNGGCGGKEDGGLAVPADLPRHRDDYAKAMQAMISLIEEGQDALDWTGGLKQYKGSKLI